MKHTSDNVAGQVASAIGKGLLAGLAATAAITISQMIEMKISGRKPSEAPAKIAEEAAGIKPANEAQKEKVSQEIHWAYGTAWGIARGLLGLAGIKGTAATAIHFASIWGSSMIMLPAFKAAPPVTEEDPKTIATDGFHHLVYAVTAGVVYEMLDSGTENERKVDRLVAALRRNGIIKKF